MCALGIHAYLGGSQRVIPQTSLVFDYEHTWYPVRLTDDEVLGNIGLAMKALEAEVRRSSTTPVSRPSH
jgi:hypothetical protein